MAKVAENTQKKKTKNQKKLFCARCGDNILFIRVLKQFRVEKKDKNQKKNWKNSWENESEMFTVQL